MQGSLSLRLLQHASWVPFLYQWALSQCTRHAEGLDLSTRHCAGEVPDAKKGKAERYYEGEAAGIPAPAETKKVSCGVAVGPCDDAKLQWQGIHVSLTAAAEEEEGKERGLTHIPCLQQHSASLILFRFSHKQLQKPTPLLQRCAEPPLFENPVCKSKRLCLRPTYEL